MNFLICLKNEFHWCFHVFRMFEPLEPLMPRTNTQRQCKCCLVWLYGPLSPSLCPLNLSTNDAAHPLLCMTKPSKNDQKRVFHHDTFKLIFFPTYVFIQTTKQHCKAPQETWPLLENQATPLFFWNWSARAHWSWWILRVSWKCCVR